MTPDMQEVLPRYAVLVRILAALYDRGLLTSWEQTSRLVHNAFTPSLMAEMEEALPGWQQMADFDNGQTLVHIACVFVALQNLPEYRQADPEQRRQMEWVVLLHDIAKEAQAGRRDAVHPFRSTAIAAAVLPGVGFAPMAGYAARYPQWHALVYEAVVLEDGDPLPDKRSLPDIVAGIEAMFGPGSAASNILKAILFHHCFSPVEDWPNPVNLSDAEIRRYVAGQLLPVLGVLLLVDSDAWSLFDLQVKERYRQLTLTLISSLAVLQTSE